MKKTLITLLTLMVPLLVTPSVQAINDPALFSCAIPVGSIIASYNTGVHGIPGNSASYTGQDTVYKIDDQYVLQCFCPVDRGSGIQSNWHQANGLTTEEIAFFVRRGWVYVANGQVWGLNNAPYIVKNDAFSCGGQGGSTTTTTSTSTSGSSTSNNSGGTGGSVQGSNSEHKPGYVLGASTLGATGTQRLLILYATFGAASAMLAIYLARN